MGVPGLFSWIRKLSPRSVQFKAPLDREVDALFVDVNAALYTVAREWPSETLDAFLASLHAYLDWAMQHFTPRSLVYFALDGVAPAGKMVTQRSRRFETAGAKGGEEMPAWWNRCAAAPGTVFMDRVAESLRALSERLSRDGRTALLSSTNVPGEGEQKLLDHVRRMARFPLEVVILGGDADILVMALAAALPGRREVICARDSYRAPKDGPRGFMAVRAGEVRSDLLRRLRARDPRALRAMLSARRPAARSTGCALNDTQLIRDWVALSCLVGNDFLPHVPSLSAYYEGLDKLTDAYKAAAVIPGSALVLSDERGRLSFDTQVLAAVLSALAATEVVDARLVNASAVTPDTETSPVEPGWAQRYNASRFGAELERACDAYLAGMLWTVEYYTRPGCPDIAWQYGFHHSPSASALAERAAHFEPPVWRGDSRPPRPLRQLMNITAPDAACVVPAGWRWLLEASDSPLARVTAGSVGAGTDARYQVKDFQAVYLLPRFDPAEMDALLDETLLDEDEARRNRTMELEVFRAE